MIQTKILKYLLPLGAIAGAYVIYKAGKTGAKVVEVVKTDLNPAYEGNIVNENIGKPITRFLTGGKYDNGGKAFYCLIHPNAAVCNQEKYATSQALQTDYSSQQTDQLYQQEADFYNDPSYSDAVQEGFLAPKQDTTMTDTKDGKTSQVSTSGIFDSGIRY